MATGDQKGFFAGLTVDQHANALAYDGPESAHWPRQIMIVCSQCGNKRCPHATDKKLACTNSNAPGQPGSAYE